MHKRSLALMIAMIFIFTAIAGRCGYIAMSKTYQVSDTYNSYTLQIGKLKPYIYDRRGKKLNNNATSFMAVGMNISCCLNLCTFFLIHSLFYFCFNSHLVIYVKSKSFSASFMISVIISLQLCFCFISPAI